MLRIEKFEVNHYLVNCYVVWDGESRRCAIVDPGMETGDEQLQVVRFIDNQGLTPVLVLLTHAHVDHIAGLRATCDRYRLPVTMHRDGAKLLRQADAYGSIMGFHVPSLDGLDTRHVDDNDTLSLGDNPIECRHVPGHCPGSLCYVLHGEKAVLTGDAIFHFSIGRTDLPGGDYDLLVERLRSRILTLDGDYSILPGHGIPSMVWKEKKYNPFLKE
ncbi:MAG: Zn-dependent hydrolase, including glyoxylase [bacterium P3]|nr:MAG: Zn-dependent hydrolase, including glyoxylase [bacterium P3]KWW42401.1 MAG: Zn-dependent hydrolase, including glyoxylase [bacterium F083]